jgi:formylglycine-generating enzyme required for sulfatase activity
MGSPPQEPERESDENQVEVTLSSGFWLGKYEVTQDQWQQVMGTNPAYFSPAGRGRNSVGLDTSRFPVEWVTWEQASEYCRRLTERERRVGQLPARWEYRLPTEAQWEYACRAGGVTAWHFGNLPTDLGRYAWHVANSSSRTHAAGDDLAPNAWGLHNVHGNVWEWCRDAYQAKLPGGTNPEVTSTEKSAARLARGGAFNAAVRSCRCADRFEPAPNTVAINHGFRVAIVMVSQ